MVKDAAIINQILDLSQSGRIHWRNFKRMPAKRTLDRENFLRVSIARKYPKKSFIVRDPMNKHQSYYAFNDNLVLVLAKNAVDDSIFLVAGEVTPSLRRNRRKIKRRDFDRNLSVYLEDSEGKLQELHDLVHKVEPRSDNLSSKANFNEFLSQELE
ncbi:MAG: hypothetical protein GX326_08085 [Clostridiaceae bacterium]|nr:hypothetical protein [Clostridiaceae bacterium]